MGQRPFAGIRTRERRERIPPALTGGPTLRARGAYFSSPGITARTLCTTGRITVISLLTPAAFGSCPGQGGLGAPEMNLGQVDIASAVARAPASPDTSSSPDVVRPERGALIRAIMSVSSTTRPLSSAKARSGRFLGEWRMRYPAVAVGLGSGSVRPFEQARKDVRYPADLELHVAFGGPPRDHAGLAWT
jgi:hypothetical protein